MLLSGGLPTRDPVKRILGNVNPDWTGGWANEFRYKSVALNMLVDFRHGGQNFSVGNWWGQYAGILKSTLNGREVDWDKPGLVLEGIDIATGKANTTSVTAEDYNHTVYPINEAGIFNTGFTKLREVRFSWDVPQQLRRRRCASSQMQRLVRRTQSVHVDELPELRSGELQQRRQRRPGLRHGRHAHDALRWLQPHDRSVTATRETSTDETHSTFGHARRRGARGDGLQDRSHIVEQQSEQPDHGAGGGAVHERRRLGGRPLGRRRPAVGHRAVRAAPRAGAVRRRGPRAPAHRNDRRLVHERVRRSSWRISTRSRSSARRTTRRTRRARRWSCRRGCTRT